MPYIEKKHVEKQINRTMFEEAVDNIPRLSNAGDLTFVMCELIGKYIEDRGGLAFQNIAEVFGALQATDKEFTRRVYYPYEDIKRERNGDIRAFEKFFPASIDR